MVVDMYQENTLIAGDLVVGGREIDPRAIHGPALLIAAEADHLTPVSACLPLFDQLGSQEKERLLIKAGHNGPVAGRGAIKGLWPKVSEWLAPRSE